MRRARWALLLLVVMLAVLGDAKRARAGDDDGPCKLATKGDSPVAKACAQGGVKKAKSLMRQMRVEANKDKSKEQVKCSHCHDHDDDDRYDTLTKDGRDRFKLLLARLGKS
jgi:hypothetical protein